MSEFGYGLFYGFILTLFLSYITFMLYCYHRRSRFTRFQAWLYDRLWNFSCSKRRPVGLDTTIIALAGEELGHHGRVNWCRLVESAIGLPDKELLRGEAWWLKKELADWGLVEQESKSG